MSDLASIWLSLCFGVAVWAILRMPLWLFTSVNRGSLWRLRDEAFDDRRRGDLPSNDATAELIENLEFWIVSVGRITWLQLAYLRKRIPRPNPAELSPFVAPAGMTDDQRRRFIRQQATMAIVVGRQMVLGSWSGVFASVRRPRTFWMLTVDRKKSARVFASYLDHRFGTAGSPVAPSSDPPVPPTTVGAAAEVDAIDDPEQLMSDLGIIESGIRDFADADDARASRKVLVGTGS